MGRKDVTHMPSLLSHLYLMRHGETAWSLSGQHTGRTDIPLTEQGEQDAGKLAERLRTVKFSRVFTSPLQRLSERADRLIARLRALEGNIAIFSHGHFGRVLAARWIGLEIREAQHLLLSTASVSILGYEHNLAEVPAIVLWNAVSKEFFT